MLAVVQRVSEARVDIAGETVGAIGAGLLVLVCAEPGDTEAQADRLVAKLLKLRIFSDDAGKMNRSVQDIADGGRDLEVRTDLHGPYCRRAVDLSPRRPSHFWPGARRRAGARARPDGRARGR